MHIYATAVCICFICTPVHGHMNRKIPSYLAARGMCRWVVSLACSQTVMQEWKVIGQGVSAR